MASEILAHGVPVAEPGLRDGCTTAAVYSQVAEEYAALRQRAALQDLSHYGKFLLRGADALPLINHLVLTDLRQLGVNRMQQSFLLDDAARPVAELLIANFGTHFLLLSEGAVPADILARLTAARDRFAAVEIEDQTTSLGLLSVDGPYSWELLKSFVGFGIIGTKYLDMLPGKIVGGVPVTLCRAGKTGEYGYMMLCESAQLLPLWDALMAAGEKFDLLPAGYRAVDLCRLENINVSLHHEGRLVGNVFEMNTRVMYGRDKADFTGRAVLQAVIENGVARKLTAISFPENIDAAAGFVVAGAAIKCSGDVVGVLANAGYSPGLARWIGLGLLDADFACVGMEYDVATEAGDFMVRTVSAPFLLNKSLTVRPQEHSFFG